MPYDNQKVQAWLARALNAPASALWRCCISTTEAPADHGELVLDLVDEFRTSSLWERTNMLYGLKDMVNDVMSYDIHCYSTQARREDDSHDEALQRILKERQENGRAATSP